MKTVHCTAITLMELIIASIVVTVVMLGVVSANIILQKNSMNYSNRFYVTQMANNVLDSMLFDASQVMGTVNAPGIVTGIGSSPADQNTTCFYNDIRAGNQPKIQDTANGQWTCYTYTPNHPTSIYKCTSNYNNGSKQGMKSCNSNDTFIGAVDTYGSASPITPIFSTPIPGVFSLTVDNCWNSAATSCCNPVNSGCVPDPSNPFVERQGSVSVAGYSAS